MLIIPFSDVLNLPIIVVNPFTIVLGAFGPAAITVWLNLPVPLFNAAITYVAPATGLPVTESVLIIWLTPKGSL